MKVYFLVPFLLFLVACQNTSEKTPKARIPEKIFDYSALEKDYEEILEAILTYNAYINGTIKSEHPKTYIEDRFTKDSISTSYKGNHPPGDEIGIRELFNHLSSSRQDSMNFLNQTRDRDTVYIPPAIAQKFRVKDSNKLIAEERFFTKLVFHLPILTHDRQKAFVSLDYLCGGWCGEGWYFILEKIKGKWKVVKDEGTWQA